ncbi:Hypothetical_protein [Hexamita inflata]|uniref:Hypothetical_protein n=1 Tax=Hexamita inflata TaxID=28002 RepID=A0AA86QWC6_9EUKA|nr:Hypothetical protein HINF_LOCUS48578 [Hexamita inflata]
MNVVQIQNTVMDLCGVPRQTNASVAKPYVLVKVNNVVKKPKELDIIQQTAIAVLVQHLLLDLSGTELNVLVKYRNVIVHLKNVVNIHGQCDTCDIALGTGYSWSGSSCWCPNGACTCQTQYCCAVFGSMSVFEFTNRQM